LLQVRDRRRRVELQLAQAHGDGGQRTIAARGIGE
jgi:hypothetical protein